MRPEASGLLDRLGVGFSVSKSGPLKDMGAFYRPPTDDERAKLQSLIDELFEAFLQEVAESRNMDLDEARRYATGEVFTARRAAETKLIDETGDFDKALDTAAELGNVRRRVKHLRPHSDAQADGCWASLPRGRWRPPWKVPRRQTRPSYGICESAPAEVAPS